MCVARTYAWLRETLSEGAQFGAEAGSSRVVVQGGRGLQPGDGKDD